ncbi:TonB-dependent receptor [Rhizobium sp. RM]|uniref:TonB-dependent siderophore receptor n=1 Tax=Rhizobium sp. RM TaxID=2748079 RepID=UPI00110E3C9B|nr:TonB-dependent receptor [Rhizobium sp. RM]NWJ23933.1 TonB-dependent siderophore receptor [Rhizobium sp. RM]TMV11205.1 TonB-dependent siderophore receptor [Rhizobium sp. Td3]
MTGQMLARGNITRTEGVSDRWQSRHIFYALIASTVLATAWTAVPTSVRAQQQADKTVSFNIPAQPLAAALSAFMRASDWDVSFTSEAVAGKSSVAVTGQMSADQALRTLLSGTGIAVRMSGARTAALVVGSAGAGSGSSADTTALAPIVVDAQGATTEGTGLYTTKQTGTATGLPLSLRETPQSVTVVTRQKMEDQNLTTIAEVLNQTPGITVHQMDSERTNVYARGFSNPTWLIDGVPTWYRIQYGSGPSVSDMVLYDRVEVLRGATGLMAGAGDPSTTINLVRKLPTDTFKGYVSGSAGSWDTYRSEFDVSGPLNAEGTVRGRFVTSLQDGDSYLDRYELREGTFYGVLEADIAEDTTLTLGSDYQRRKSYNTQFGGFPLFHVDGSLVDYDRSFNPGGGNLPYYQDFRTHFARLDHEFDNGWKLHSEYSYYRAKRWGALASASWGVIADDGTGGQMLGGFPETTTTQHAINAYVEGPVEFFGREHDLRFGVTSAIGQDEHKALGEDFDYMPLPGSIFDWNGDFDIASYQGDISFRSLTKINQTGIYGSGRFSLTDDLSLIAGSRVVFYDYKFDSESFSSGAKSSQRSKRNGEWIPYAGLVYDLDDHWSVYGSYTSIFKQQAYRDKNNAIIDPTTGSNFEAGIKGAFYDDRLNVSLAGFYIKQDDLATRDRSVTARLPDGTFAYKSIDGAITRGVELEVSGEVLPGWQLGGGFTHSRTEDAEGQRISTVIPENMIRIATSYTIPDTGLTVGGNVSWQSKIFNSWTWPATGTAVQDSYAVVGLMARYDFENGVTASLNVNNVFDEKYYSSFDETYATGNFGAPRNVTFTLKKTF